MAEDHIDYNSASAEKEMKEIPLGDVEKETAPEAILKHGLDADEAMKAFIGHEGEEIALDEETNKRLLRKIDMNIMPVGWGTSYMRSLEAYATAASLCYLWTQLPRQ